MDIAILLVAAAYGAVKLADLAVSMWALLLSDDRVTRALTRRVSPHKVASLLPTAAREWNRDEQSEAWSWVFDRCRTFRSRGPVASWAGLVLIGIAFRSPLLTSWQAIAVFCFGDAYPNLGVVVALTAMAGITSTLVFYLVTLSLGENAEARAGHVPFRPTGASRSALPSLLTLPAVIAALLLGFAAVYYAISIADPSAFVITTVSPVAATAGLDVMDAIYFTTTGRDVSPTSPVAQLLVVTQTFFTITGVALFVSAANSALRPSSVAPTQDVREHRQGDVPSGDQGDART